MINISSYLKKMVGNNASDLFLTVGVPPSVKIHGDIQPISEDVFSANDVASAVLGLMNEDQRNEFNLTNESNFAFGVKDVGRFRVSAFIQRNQIGCVIRHIQTKIPTIDELELPPIIKALSMLKKGLVIVTGATGMGKTTTLASMLDYHNKHSRGHILTIEDPIEYLHSHRKCIVTQREVGIDTASFSVALKNAMRQAPDVILIGEIRDLETMRHALAFAETGHLCLATLHANNANQSLERIAHFYPENFRSQLWMDLSINLRATISQRLVRRVNEGGRVPAIEVMINTPLIAECIRKGETHLIKEYMSRENGQGMQTLDQALFALYDKEKISETDALQYADSANNLRIMIKQKNPLPDISEKELKIEESDERPLIKGKPITKGKKES